MSAGEVTLPLFLTDVSIINVVVNIGLFNDNLPIIKQDEENLTFILLNSYLGILQIFYYSWIRINEHM